MPRDVPRGATKTGSEFLVGPPPPPPPPPPLPWRFIIDLVDSRAQSRLLPHRTVYPCPSSSAALWPLPLVPSYSAIAAARTAARGLCAASPNETGPFASLDEIPRRRVQTRVETLSSSAPTPESRTLNLSPRVSVRSPGTCTAKFSKQSLHRSDTTADCLTAIATVTIPRAVIMFYRGSEIIDATATRAAKRDNSRASSRRHGCPK